MIVYLHGFNSSPHSHKAQLLGRYLQQRGLGAHYACPELPVSASAAVAAVEPLIGAPPACFVGSSLGGFYATYLAEKHGAKAVLINPAIDPHIGLRAYLGAQKNLHSGEAYELTESHLREWERLYVPRITSSRHWLIVETGDEVLDYRRALERYRGARQLVIAGGDHSLQSFSGHMQAIVEFAGLVG